MSQAQAVTGEPAVKASDAERDQAAEILRVAYAEGRLTRAELDERIDAAYAAKTRADLRDLTSDLPGAIPAQAHRTPAMTDLPVPALAPGTGTGMYLDRCLLLCLLIAFPPASRHRLLDPGRPAPATLAPPPCALTARRRGWVLRLDDDDPAAVAPGACPRAIAGPDARGVARAPRPGRHQARPWHAQPARDLGKVCAIRAG